MLSIRHGRFALLAGLVAAAACGGSGSGPTPVTPTKVVFTTQPTNAFAGAVIAPAVKVTLEDANGAVAFGATDQVTIAIGTNPAAGTLSGTLTVAAVAGVATFPNLSINNVGTGYTLTASSGALTGATSSAFNVTPAPVPTKLAFTVQPSNVSTATAINPAVKVAIQDQNGATVTTSTAQVTLAIANNPSAGTLSGTLTVAAVAGVATFNNLKIDNAGTGYTLTATSAGLTLATSAAFNVLAPPPIPGTAAVTVGSGGANQIVFVSAHNGTSNPAVDTVSIATGGGTATVTWTWAGSAPHSVESTGAPAFTSSGIGTAPMQYQFGFTAAGTYQYNCAVHGNNMTGRVVVKP